jgi:hypothetical protein
VLRTGSVELSGLLAEPETPPRALVPALHGGGMTAAYFHGRAHPDLSLLRLGWPSTRRCSPRRRGWSGGGSRRPATTSAWGGRPVPTT